jgi:molybdenum cofactor cytidylyltransferase
MEKGGAKKVSGVILAAGLGSRFGGGKLMHRVLGQPLFSYALESALASDLHQVVMVCGLETAKAAPHDPRLICLVNPRPEKGQAGSLRLGLNRISPDADHVLFMLADQPLITPELLNRYVSLAARGAQMVCMGRGDYLGPPALFSRGFFDELDKLEGDQGAGRLLRKYRPDLRVLDPGDDRPAWDVDRPGDLNRIETELKARQ